MKNCRLELVALELDTTLDVPPRLLRLDAELLEGVGGMRFVAASLRCGSSVTAAAASNFGDDRSSEQSRAISQTRVGGPGLTRAGGAGLKMAEDARRDDRRRSTLCAKSRCCQTSNWTKSTRTFACLHTVSLRRQMSFYKDSESCSARQSKF